MEPITVRLLPLEDGSGAYNMAADETMLRSAACGLASFRVYTWSQATVSLGYFQSHTLREQLPELSPLPFVRRPSGGQTLVHHHELTYALALPAESVSRKSTWWLEQMHELVASVLNQHAIRATMATAPIELQDSFLCFHHVTPGDLVLADHKICGSAQRRQHGALLQHGSILLQTSPYTPGLPGIAQLVGNELQIAELHGALVAQLSETFSGTSVTGCEKKVSGTFCRNGPKGAAHKRYLTPFSHTQLRKYPFSWCMADGKWSASERESIQDLMANKYGHSNWNHKR